MAGRRAPGSRGLERRAFLAGLLPLAATLPKQAAEVEEILVFAAASLTDALQEIGTAFEKDTGHRVLFSFAASGDLARQIRAGAPADVFVSADVARMDELQQAGLVRAADRIELVSNRLVIVVPVSSQLGIQTAKDLARVHRLALGDPEAVPAGVYARLWLEGLGLWQALRERALPALDVRAALAAVEVEAADAGIVYLTDARVSKRVRVAFEVPAEKAPRIVYPAALLARSTRPAARAFLGQLRSPEALSVFARRGFVALVRR